MVYNLRYDLIERGRRKNESVSSQYQCDRVGTAEDDSADYAGRFLLELTLSAIVAAESKGLVSQTVLIEGSNDATTHRDDTTQ